MDNIKIEKRRLSFEFVYETLRKISSLFTPPLSESLDIKAYARKLSDKAQFIVCMNENEILGFMAYYLNSSYQQIYITLICVDIKYQSHGIGGMMLDYVTSNTCESDKLYETIALEVNKKNGKAHRFYLKQGFEEQEDRGEKLLMIKHI